MDRQLVNPRTKTGKETDVNRTTHHKQGPAWAALVTAAAICLALAPAATAADIAQVRAGSGGLDFQPRVEYGALVLTVSGPDGFHHRAEFGAGESPAFSIFDQAGGVLPDGSYTWELSVVPSDSQRRDAFEANRMEVKRGGVERQVQTGGFAVVAGSVVAGGETEPGAGPAGAGNGLYTKDQVIPDDLIVQMSLCVGFDCVNNENFGFDTIRLKENNLRIHFDDTSNTGSFPANDWRLVANDSANGGRNVFYLEDSATGREVFSVEAGAPTNALWVDSTGNVGFGTSTPVLQLHVKDGNTPALRLEQDGSSGFSAQTWDVAGNEANFFVRDVTNGSKLPFRIRPNAPTSSIDIAASGDVGIGTQSPEVELHILATGEAATDVQFKIEANTDPAFDFEEQDSGVTWRFINNNAALKIVDIGTGTDPAEEFSLTQAGNLTITGDYFSATCTSPGSPCAPDYVFAPGYDLMPLDELRAFVQENRHLPKVPSEAELREARQINLSKFQLTLLEKVEELTLYTLSLHETIEDLQADRDAKAEDLASLQEQIARLKEGGVAE
jgi:hypothetical protein